MTRQPVQHDFPRLNTPLVELESGIISRPWHRLLIELWKKVGSAFLSVANAVYIGQDPSQVGVSVSAFSATTGNKIGDLLLTNAAPAPPVPQALGASPFVFAAPKAGTLVVFSGKVELSRDGATWYEIGLMGGAVPVLAGDQVRVTWFQADAPTVTFFPVSVG